jgi:hypothetical protein
MPTIMGWLGADLPVFADTPFLPLAASGVDAGFVCDGMRYSLKSRTAWNKAQA